MRGGSHTAFNEFASNGARDKHRAAVTPLGANDVTVVASPAQW